MLDKIIIPTLTFFKNGEIDIDANLKYIKYLNASLVENIILLGTTSEGVLISLAEKKKLITLYSKHLKDNINIILAPSLWAINDFKYLMNLDTRINDILFLPNSYFNRGEESIKLYLKKLFKNSNKNIILYNLPKNTLVDFTPKIVQSLIKSGLNIKGIKLSHCKMELINEYKSINNLSIMYGSDKNIQGALKNGAEYVVCQNLSACINKKLQKDNIQMLADEVRTQVLKNTNKIAGLKQYINLNNSGFSEEVF